jgi:phosphatidylserine/phosphatidylglycerophosphate/cardiolipin synthase-like enzyme
VEAKNRGVKIRVVMDKDQSSNRNSKLQYFLNNGLETKLESRTMHNKYAIIDGKKLITGSYNWTAAAEKNNFENIVIVSNAPGIIKSYQDNFDGIWRISE